MTRPRQVVGDGQRGEEDLEPAGTRRPSRARTPSAKAMSVAIGMPQPSPPGPPALKAT